MKYEVYCDESCIEALFDKSAHNYTVIGGIWVPAENRKELKIKINALKGKYGKYGELKWNKVSTKTLPLYKELIDFFFNTFSVRFRAITIKSVNVNNDLFNNGSGELGFYKFYYQLIYHWLFYTNSYKIFLDYKVNAQRNRVNDLCATLRNSTSATIELAQALPSEQSVLIQLADVLSGVVSSSFNKELSAESPKNEIIKLVENYLGHEIMATSPNELKFNVFDINLRKGW